jgi:hypothetical protein
MADAAVALGYLMAVEHFFLAGKIDLGLVGEEAAMA